MNDIITRISEEEEYKLRTLFENANKSDLNEDWMKIQEYMAELGLKYGFEPKKVKIDTRGNVRLLPGATVWVVYNTEGKGDVLRVFYDKKKMAKWMIDNDHEFNEFKEVPIE